MINSCENIRKNSNEEEIIRNDRKEEISNETLELEEIYKIADLHQTKPNNSKIVSNRNPTPEKIEKKVCTTTFF